MGLTVFCLLSVFAVSGNAGGLPKRPGERIVIVADDGFELSARWRVLESVGPAVLLLHQGDREGERTGWEALTEILHESGFHTLELDFRGFGESVNDQFRPGDFGAAGPHHARDARSAYDWLARQDVVDEEKIAIVGASMGGTQAVAVASVRPRVQGLVLLSANLRRDPARTVLPVNALPMALWAAEDDPWARAADAARQAFATANHSLSVLHIVPGSLHGTPLLERDPARREEIALWLEEVVEAELVSMPGAGLRFSSAEEFFQPSREVAARAASQEPLGALHPVHDWPVHLWASRALAKPEAMHEGGLWVPLEQPSAAELSLLATYSGEYLFLPALRSLDPASARALACSRVSGIFLDGLERLEPWTFELLAVGRRRLSFAALEQIDVVLAERMAEFGGALSLDGVAELSEDVAAALSTWSGYGEQCNLSLNGLRTLTPAAAESLAAIPGWGLSLDGLEELPLPIAERLARWRGARLTLDGLRAVDAELARVLRTAGAKWIVLGGVRAVSEEVSELLDGDGPTFVLARR